MATGVSIDPARFGPLVEADWLKQHLGDPDLAVFDCRFSLGEPEAGRRDYLAGHVPGALHLDLEKHLSDRPGQGRGRHPLPDPERLAEHLGRMGADKRSTVVVYDDGSGSMAPRAWWLLGYLGLDTVAVLNGGWQAWLAARGSVAVGSTDEQAAESRPPRTFTATLRDEWICDLSEVEQLISGEHPATALIDSRAPERYRGDVEPLDPVAGHIPSAMNLPWTGTLAGGRWRDPAELARHFASLGEGDAIVYCGSGVTACGNLLAMRLAGIERARLYPGSWSEWCADPRRPVARGDA